ncbi:MAG TPA: aminotransferase class I/II-fold pyridoxal phosphate-dependent enzyme [Caulobacteraceae bacterium]|nr:aminotransferase class I/II-fold pyridoxal phosphate-dependent enzyme [Caulobacteraceae bacterium]
MTAKVDPFRSLAIGRLAYRMQAEGRSVIHMEYGQPSVGAPKAAIAAAHRVLDTDAMGYWESPALKARIARHYDEAYGVTVAPEQVILTCGASPALLLALTRSFAPGDRVALARPGYVAYRNTLKALHMVPVEIACGPAERFGLTAAALAALEPAPRGVIVASPANPTGAVLDAAELAAIVRVCQARGIRIISDETYHGLTYGEPAHSLLEFEPRAFVINTFSKYYSMVGWRLGWVVAPPDQAEQAHAYMAHMFLTAPSLSQHAGLVTMDCVAELQAHLEMYRANRALMLQAMPELGLTGIAPPDGAFYIYADIGHLTADSMAFCETLLRETGVAAAPGLDFDPVEGPRFMRFSFAVTTPEVREAISRLIPWFQARGRAAGS